LRLIAKARIFYVTTMLVLLCWMSMAALPSWVEASSRAYAADTSRFGGLGKAGLITVIVVSIIFIVTFVWLFRGTKKRD